MAPIKGDWIYNDSYGFIYEGFFDHELGYAKVK
jgi:hypothetical protein